MQEHTVYRGISTYYLRTAPLKAQVTRLLDSGVICSEDRKYFAIYHSKKSKAVRLQAWSGPEGSRKLRFPDFMITAQDGGKVVSLTHQPHLAQKILLVDLPQ
jgi:hypothetical protein